MLAELLKRVVNKKYSRRVFNEQKVAYEEVPRVENPD